MEEIRDFDLQLVEGQVNFVNLNDTNFQFDYSGRTMLLGGKLRANNIDAKIESYTNAVKEGHLPRFFFKTEFGELTYLPIVAMRKSTLDNMETINIIVSALTL